MSVNNRPWIVRNDCRRPQSAIDVAALRFELSGKPTVENHRATTTYEFAEFVWLGHMQSILHNSGCRLLLSVT